MEIVIEVGTEETKSSENKKSKAVETGQTKAVGTETSENVSKGVEKKKAFDTTTTSSGVKVPEAGPKSEVLTFAKKEIAFNS